MSETGRVQPFEKQLDQPPAFGDFRNLLCTQVPTGCDDSVLPARFIDKSDQSNFLFHPAKSAAQLHSSVESDVRAQGNGVNFNDPHLVALGQSQHKVNPAQYPSEAMNLKRT